MAMDDATLVKYSASYVLRAQSDADVCSGKVFPLRGEMLVGREQECAISLNSSHISRYHAKINVSSGGVYIEDLLSTNGTYVNGQRIKGRVRLSLGDEVAFDDLSFRLTSKDSGGAQDTLLSTPTISPNSSREQSLLLPDEAPPPVNPIFHPSRRARTSEGSSALPETPEEGPDTPPNPEILDQVDQILAPASPSPIHADLEMTPTAAERGAQASKGLEGSTEDDSHTQVLPAVRMDELAARSRSKQYELNIGSGPRLIIMSAPLRGKWFELNTAPLGTTWLIGRDAQADICLSDKTISTDHARLTKAAEGYRLSATHAKNGLLINGRTATHSSLQHNDRIQIGGTELVFRTDEADSNLPPVRPPDYQRPRILHYTAMGLAILLVALVTAIFALAS